LVPPFAAKEGFVMRFVAVGLCAFGILAWSGALFAEAPSWEERAKALEGGQAVPDKAGTVSFPWIGKQSVMAVGDASVERMVAVVDFSDDGHDALGSVTLDGKGGGTATFAAKATDLRTGHGGRDVKLCEPTWIDAKTNPNLELKVTKLERVKPTVWKATGTWTMNGVAKPVEFLLNVRWIGAMQYVADDGVVRVSGSFPILLKDHNVGGEWAGTPAVAAEWTVQVVLIGVFQPAK
jgi:polyisoprenoid-binding protein YceI